MPFHRYIFNTLTVVSLLLMLAMVGLWVDSYQASSASSQLNNGIDRLEFAAGVVDSHLPVDAALSAVDVR